MSDSIINSNSKTAEAFKPFGTSIFTEMTALCNQTGAVNLSQGFPDFDGPLSIRKKAAEAIINGPNQYVASMGIAPLRHAIAKKIMRFYGIEVDADEQITVTSGATEGLAASLLGILNPGDRVVLLEPCYDLYPPIIARAGAKAVYVPLVRPDFSIDADALSKAFKSGVKAMVINNPLNPLGKVFSLSEIELIRDLCVEYDTIVISDEVYEHLIYDGLKHTTLLAVPGLQDHAIVVSSTAKTFSMTGWKVGYVVASPLLSEAVRMSHQFLTFCTPGAFQAAMAEAIGMDTDYYDSLLSMYSDKRKKLCAALEGLGLNTKWPQGTYFATVNIAGLGFNDDLEFCRYLAKDIGVGAVPQSFFWKDRRDGRDLVRFCFCKKDETLEEAVLRLRRWRG